MAFDPHDLDIESFVIGKPTKLDLPVQKHLYDKLNSWNGEMYLKADSIRDWIRHRAIIDDIEIPQEIEDLINLICEMPSLNK